MQTTRDAVQMAGTQQPLLREDQLVPGVIITGVAMSFAWELYRIDGEQLELMKLPSVSARCADNGHTYSPYGRGQVCARCNMRRQAISEFMPRTADKPRAHVITVPEPLQTIQPYTLYGYMVGSGLKVVSLQGTQWSEALPIVPQLHVLWTLPERLRELVGGASQIVEAED